MRIRVGIGAGLVATAVLAFAACGACGKRGGGGDVAAPATSTSGSAESKAAARGVPAQPRAGTLVWTSAKDGDPEDLATLATDEGAAGLVEAAEDPALRPTAIKAMAYAEGWAQMPYLAKVATDGEDSDAALALASVVELAARPRRSEDVEDASELEAGCTALVSLARDETKDRRRRVEAVRALRMMPCPPAELPTSLDAR